MKIQPNRNLVGTIFHTSSTICIIMERDLSREPDIYYIANYNYPEPDNKAWWAEEPITRFIREGSWTVIDKETAERIKQ